MADNKELQDLVDFLRSSRQEVSSPGSRHAMQVAATNTSGIIAAGITLSRFRRRQWILSRA